MTKRAISATAFLTVTLVFVLSFAEHGSAEKRRVEGVTVAVTAKMRPNVLPRRGRKPIRVSFGSRISTVKPAEPPKLTKLTIEINRHGRLDTHGLPRCLLRNIKPSTNREALAVCGSALVGEGHFSADVRFPDQSPFPSDGKVLAFNGLVKGKPAVLAHIYGTEPVPTSYVLPFRISRGTGTYGTVLAATFPDVTGEWGFVTGLTMSLYRRFAFHGRSRGYLSAGCPALKGTRKASFSLTRTSFEFEGGPKIVMTLPRTCTVRH